MSYNILIQALKGGSGSGNFGHSGRPGHLGGSAAMGADKGGAGIGGVGGSTEYVQSKFVRKVPKQGVLDVNGKKVNFEKLSKQSDPNVPSWQVSGDDYLYKFSSGDKSGNLMIHTTRSGELSAVSVPGVKGEWLGSTAIAKGLAYHGIK